MSDEAKTVFTLDHETIRKMVRAYGPKIGLLAKRGDLLSKKMVAVWSYLHDHPTDSRADLEMRAVFSDWMKQHLEVTARKELGRKHGYLVEGEDPSGATKILTLQ